MYKQASWDLIAEKRAKQIESGIDISWHCIVKVIISFMQKENRPKVLDVGGGTGHLASMIASSCKRVTSIDISPAMIKIAKERHNFDNLTFVNEGIDMFLDSNKGKVEIYDTVIAHMFFMNYSHVDSFLSRVGTIMNAKSELIISICNPWTWWRNFRQDSLLNCKYQEQQYCSWPQNIGLDSSKEFFVPYYHRPWSWYHRVLNSSGFRIKKIKLLNPNATNIHGVIKSHHEARYRVLICQHIDL